MELNVLTIGLGVLALITLVILGLSVHFIGPTDIGLVLKRFSRFKLPDDNPIAFKGEAGYQAELLMPGFRFKFWLMYQVTKHPWVQVPADGIGIVIAQIGGALPPGAKTAVYKHSFGQFSHPATFIKDGGQKGVQRTVLPPGTSLPLHPIAFLVIVENQLFGVPISQELEDRFDRARQEPYKVFGLERADMRLVRVAPQLDKKTGILTDMVGIVEVLDGDPLNEGDIACRLGGFQDIQQLMDNASEGDTTLPARLIEALLASKNHLHNNYQDFQAFLDNGGRIGLQHDPLVNGSYALNPLCVRVRLEPMLIVEQGQVAVIKSYVGLVTDDTSGSNFKYGSLVMPGRRGIWQEALRTGKYPLNPLIYKAEIVQTAIVTLNWADANSSAHSLDRQLSQIIAKSNEGFVFRIDLQVQIHVPDTKAPYVISMVGSMENLVNEVLQAAVGNHFRDKLQSMPAVRFIQTRQQVQVEALEHMRAQLKDYMVETLGVYIQDVILPEELVRVLTEREIASQQIETYGMQQRAEKARIDMEASKGTADMQHELAQSKVGIDIETNKAQALQAKAEGEATYIAKKGEAESVGVRAVGLARAEGYQAQINALGQQGTVIVNALTVLAEHNVQLVPDTLSLVTGGSSSGAVDGLAGVLTTLAQRFTVTIPTTVSQTTDQKDQS